MSATKSELLPVPGATLYYKARGAGPILLLLPGGAGDADGFEGVASRLVDHYTVVTYDRRGLSRSSVDDPTAPSRLQTRWLQTHSDDVHRLLAAVTTEPAFVAGSSIGALIGLDFVCRYPAQVRAFVAHEPPVPELLPEPDRARAVQDQADAEEAFRRDGLMAAMRKFLEFTGMNQADREPDLDRPQPGPYTAQNLTFFLTYDAPAVRQYRLNLAALQAASDRIVPAAGSTNSAFWVHRCAEALAARLGKELAEFPGGHGGFASHPNGFAAKLGQILGG